MFNSNELSKANNDDNRQKTLSKIKNKLFGGGALLLAASILLIVFFVKMQSPKSSDKASTDKLIAKVPDKEEPNHDFFYEKPKKRAPKQDKPEDLMAPEYALELAKRAAKAGLKVYGQAQCRATQIQRRMFGDRESAARKQFEKIYIECRHPQDCPSIYAYPTWVFGEHKRPAVKGPLEIEQLISEAKSSVKIQMLQEPSEPVDEVNIPSEIHAVKHLKLPAPDTVELISKEVEKRVEQKMKELEAAAKQSNEEKKSDDSSKTENMRGLTPLGNKPLAAVIMPGGQSMNETEQRWQVASNQGNPPRHSQSNRDFVEELAYAQTQALKDAYAPQTQLDPNASTFAQAQLPHSRQITSGSGLDNKQYFMNN